jgi:hypothetical protein
VTPDQTECICGHERRFHEHCSDAYPALCTYEVSPGEDYPICHCLEFEADPPDQREED